MNRELQGQRVLITGASSGIGQALATQAAQAGMRVLLVGRTLAPLQALAQTLTAQGHVAHAAAADITVAADRARLFHTAQEQLGGLDVLINNAGVGTQGPFDASSEALLRQVMAVNFFAPAELMRQAVPLLEKGRQPAVVQISSMTGRRSMPFWTEYSASKFAICGLVEALRAEFIRFGIDVLLIVPGVTSTNLGKHLLHHDGKIAFQFQNGMTTDYVAGRILDALRRGKPETVLGWEARWIIRANRFFPRLVDLILKRVVRKRYPPTPSI